MVSCSYCGKDSGDYIIICTECEESENGQTDDIINYYKNRIKQLEKKIKKLEEK